MSADITLVFEALMPNASKPALYLSVATDQDHDIVGISKVRYMNIRTNLKPWVALQCLTKNPIDNVVEEGSARVMVFRD